MPRKGAVPVKRSRQSNQPRKVAPPLKPSRESDRRRERLVAICRSLPEVEVTGDEHLAFRVRKKIFGYYLFDHHRDGMVALCCKAAPGEQSRLVEEDPRRFFVPPYVGPKGWIALRLDLREPNWSEVTYLVRTAYRMTAPRTLAARLDEMND